MNPFKKKDVNDESVRPAAVIFDLDGTLYLGEHLIAGADVAVETLRKAGLVTTFLTNKPIDSPAIYAEKLSRLGIPVTESDVLTSVTLTIDFLQRSGHGDHVFVIGEDYLTDQIRQAGFRIASTPQETDVVVVSLDRTMSYEKMRFALEAARNGAHMCATNPDVICPMDSGEIVDAGAWIAGLEALLKRPITDVLGKPSARCAETVLARVGCEASRALMVGDRLETDMTMARNAGMQTALVMSGVTGVADLKAHGVQPDYVLGSVAELPDALGVA
ncbi:MAG: HAD family hydrolase [Gemmatimonadetes bacterium]|nr:HAD family hydrolase [Gemmatimonadota bacterium]